MCDTYFRPSYSPDGVVRGRALLHLFAIAFFLALWMPSTARGQLALADSKTFNWGWEERYGSAVAIGDFNGDGRNDVASGSPYADFGDSITNMGRVFIWYLDEAGEPFDLTTTTWCEDSSDRGDGYLMGSAVAFGDFDGDGDDDFVVGMPGAEVDGTQNAGAVCVWYGGQLYLEPENAQRLDQGVTLQDFPEDGDRFGAVLATGDLNGDQYDDLAIAAPDESLPGADHAGVVHVIFGGPNGLDTSTDLIISRNTPGVVAWPPTEDERFGSALVIGDFMGTDGIGDLAVGSPGDSSVEIGGSVTIFAGTELDLLVLNYFPITTDGIGWDLLGTATEGDEFGGSLAAGDFDGDGDTDLAIGSPREADLTPEEDTGAVMVLYRGDLGLTDVDEQVFFESLTGGVATAYDQFGKTLVAGDFDSDGRSDLAIGSPLDNPFGVVNAGRVTVLYGAVNGLDLAGFQTIGMSFFGGLEAQDRFSGSLAAGKVLDTTGGDDLLIGVPGRARENNDGIPLANSGMSILIQSSLFFSEGFETGDLSGWSSFVN